MSGTTDGLCSEAIEPPAKPAPSRPAPRRILVVDPIAEWAIERLRAAAHEVTVRLRPSPPELMDLVADADVLVVRSGVRITADTIAAARSLELIARAGSGLDNIDVEAARAAGVQVVHLPGGSANAVAELALGLLLASARRIPLGDARLRLGCAEKASLVGTELGGQTLGLVGLGAIGTRVAQLAGAFEMRVLGCVAAPSARRTHELRSKGVELVAFDTLLARADFLCLAVPLTDATRRLIGARELRAMKPTAHLVNVSRAGVVDEDALVEALRGGRIAGAATDVPGDECDGRHLADVDRLVMTPHLGATTTAAHRRIGRLLVAAIEEALLNGRAAGPAC